MVSVCGMSCKLCSSYPQGCHGCFETQGRAPWVSDVSLETCHIYNCCMQKNYTLCGECDLLPCTFFMNMRDEEVSEKEHFSDILWRTTLLREKAKRNYPWLESYLLTKPGAYQEYKEEWLATRFLVGDKMFAMRGYNKARQAIITLKLEPAHGLALREKYTDITPGYYMNKQHWNSVLLSGSVPDHVLRDLIDTSYTLILSAIPKDQLEVLLAEENAIYKL